MLLSACPVLSSCVFLPLELDDQSVSPDGRQGADEALGMPTCAPTSHPRPVVRPLLLFGAQGGFQKGTCLAFKLERIFLVQCNEGLKIPG